MERSSYSIPLFMFLREAKLHDLVDYIVVSYYLLRSIKEKCVALIVFNESLAGTAIGG